MKYAQLKNRLEEAFNLANEIEKEKIANGVFDHHDRDYNPVYLRVYIRAALSLVEKLIHHDEALCDNQYVQSNKTQHSQHTIEEILSNCFCDDVYKSDNLTFSDRIRQAFQTVLDQHKGSK